MITENSQPVKHAHHGLISDLVTEVRALRRQLAELAEVGHRAEWWLSTVPGSWEIRALLRDAVDVIAKAEKPRDGVHAQ